MATAASAPVPAEREPAASLQDGVIGTLSAFGNPPATASRLKLRWFWIYPFILFATAVDISQVLLTAQRAHITQVMLEARGLTGAQIDAQMAMAAKFAPIGLVVAPIFLLAIFALSAFLVRAVASVVGKEGRYSHFLGLVTAGATPAVVQIIAGAFLVRMRNIDEIRSSTDLQPPFGLNVFIDSAPKAFEALIGFFSIFEIWAIIMTAMIFAYAFKASLGKSFLATSPAWILGSIFAIIGSLFG